MRSQNCETWLLALSCLSLLLSVHSSAWNNSPPTSRIFMKFGIGVFFENMFRKFKFRWNLTRITGTLHEDRYLFFYHISFNSSYSERYFRQICTENQNTRFMFNNFFLSQKSCHLWDNVENTVEPGRSPMNKGRMRIACWNTHAYKRTLSEYIILTVFPLRQWLQKRASVLSYSAPPVLIFSIGSTRALGPARPSIQHVYPLVKWATLPPI